MGNNMRLFTETSNYDKLKATIAHLDKSIQEKILELIEIPHKNNSDVLFELIEKDYLSELNTILPFLSQESISIQNALLTCLKKNDLESLKRLHYAGASLETLLNVDPLIFYAAYYSMNCFKYIFEQTENVNHTHPKGYTLMHVAALGGKKEVIDYVLKNDRTKNQVLVEDLFGYLPCDIALENGFNEIYQATCPADHHYQLTANKNDISQENLIKKLNKYIQIKNNLTTKDEDKLAEIISQDGLCNGLAFMYAWLFGRTNNDDEFYKLINHTS